MGRRHTIPHLFALVAVSAASVAVGAVVGGSTPVQAAGERVALGRILSPGPTLSTSGDFATDTFGNPWDFDDAQDVIPVNGVGVTGAASPPATVSGGVLTVPTHNGSEIRPLMAWPGVLPWGHDGWAHPIDAGRYTVLDLSVQSDIGVAMAVRWTNAQGQTGIMRLTLPGGPGFNVYHYDLTDPANYPFPGFNPVWSGPIVSLVLVRNNADAPGDPTVNVAVDWIRLHRADASNTPPVGVPVAKVLTPSIEGGADFATTEQGNPWDFTSFADVAGLNDVANAAISPAGDLTGDTVGNDGFVEVPLTTALNTDRYHRLTVDACYGGNFDLGGSPGGGMVGRLNWQVPDRPGYATTQDFVVFPGPCQRMTIDLATDPASALNDEGSQLVTGWRGVRPTSLRFDLNEDPGRRAFTLREIRLADDAAFSTTYPITFTDAAGAGGATADIYVTTTAGQYDGTLIGSMPVNGGAVNTFNWNGTTSTGAAMPNSTYWVYVVMKNTAGTSTGYSTGPVRVDKPVPPTPSYYVPLTPARLLDTRTGEGGNISPLVGGTFTELPVTGVGGVPSTGVTAVVMNVTATNTVSEGYLTAWPSGETQPLVSNLNFVPGQTVPNLVTVKVGANGRVNLYNSSGSTDVIADVMGYYTSTAPPTGGRFTALTPTRLLDTRDGTGRAGSTAPVGFNASIDLSVTGVGGVPSSGVSAVALNVTVDQPTGTGYLTVWPTGEARPTASTHNFVPGLTVANLVLAKVGAGGSISIYNSAGASHVVADVIGYYSSTGGAFVALAPQRLVDSRSGLGTGAAPLGTGEARTITVAGGSPIPANAKAVVVNVTSVNSTIPSYVTVWPTAAAQPLASTLNPRPGVPVPNQAYLRLGAGGALDVFNANGSTDFIVDVFGYIT